MTPTLDQLARDGTKAFSWNQLGEKAFPRLLAGTFTTDYQQTLVGEFETTLGI